MFKPVDLTRVRVVCSKRRVEDVVAALYDFGVIEVKRASVFSQSNKPLPVFKDISDLLISLRSVEKQLEAVQVDGKRAPVSSANGSGSNGFPELTASISEARSIPLAKFSELQASLSVLSSEKSDLQARLNELRLFKGVGVKPSLIYSSSRLHFVFISIVGVNDVLSKGVARLGGELVQGKEWVLVAVPSANTEKLGALVSSLALKAIAIPRVQEESFAHAFDGVQARLNTIDGELREAQSAVEEFKKQHFSKIVFLRKALEFEARKAELPALFGESAALVAVEGWVPEKLYATLQATLNSSFKEAIVVEKIFGSSRHGLIGHGKEEEDAAPVLLKNNVVVQPFEFLTRFFSLPGAHDIDPTPFVALSFPIFFGMILGDIGYGLVALALAFVLKSKFKEGFYASVAGMMFLSALTTIFFGFVFGEFLGSEHVLGFELHPIIHRIEEEGLQELMSLSVLVGFIHLALGFAIGAVSNAVEKHYKHALAKTAWLVLELSLISFLTLSVDVSFFELLKPLAHLLPGIVWGVLALASLLAIGLSEGFTALFELPGLFANLFSYLRLMALGVAGAILALIISKIPLNTSFTDAWSVISFVLFLALFTFAHIVSLLLGMFESSIQSLRLHYVEFFSKFYRGGGVAFTPLVEKKLRKFMNQLR